MVLSPPTSSTFQVTVHISGSKLGINVSACASRASEAYGRWWKDTRNEDPSVFLYFNCTIEWEKPLTQSIEIPEWWQSVQKWYRGCNREEDQKNAIQLHNYWEPTMCQCYGLTCFSPPNSDTEALTFNVSVFRNRAYTLVIKVKWDHKGRVLIQYGWCPSRKRRHQRSPDLFLCLCRQVRTHPESSCLQLRRCGSTRHQPWTHSPLVYG